MLSPVTTDKRTLVVTTAPDRARDRRIERFWEAVCKLIFNERRTQGWKRTVLSRYSRALNHMGDASLADLASRLADSYEDSLTGTTHWS